MSEEARHKWILVLCCFSQFTVVLDISIINVALPSMSSDLGITSANLHWVINAYTIAFGGFLLLGGRAADIVGRREVFVGGLGLLVAGSLLGGVAQSQEMLIGARAIQGLGAAAVAPATLSILMVTFTEGAGRNRALGLWSATGAVGGAIGGLIGGIITDGLSWRWVLLVNVPVAVALMTAALVVMHGQRRDQRPEHKADIAGAVLVTVAMVALTFGIAQTESHAWDSAATMVPMLLALVLFVAFVVVEARIAEEPLVPLSMFKIRSLSGATAAVACLGFSSFSMWLLVSLYSQEVLGYSAIEAGLVLIVPSVLLGIGSRVASPLCIRFGPGLVLASGLALLAMGLLGLTQVSANGSYMADLFIPMNVAGIGIGFSFVGATVSASTGAAASVTGLTSGMLTASRQLGASIGIAVLTTAAAHHAAGVLGSETPKQALSSGFAYAFAISAVFALLGAIVALVVLSRKPVGEAPPALA